MLYSRLKTTLALSLMVSLPLMSTASAMPPQKWKIDPTKTKVNFEVSYLQNSTLKGKFKKVDGTIHFDESRPQDTVVNFTVQTDSVDTDLRARDYLIRSRELLNTKQYPTLKFVSTNINLTSPRAGYVTGNFTAIGKTKPLKVKVTLTDSSHSTTQKPVLKFTATGSINRHDYGVTAFPNIFGTNIPINISGELIPAN